MFKVVNPFPNTNVPRTVRFTEGLFEELNRIAQAHDISFDTLVLQCCRYALDNMEEEEEEKK